MLTASNYYSNTKCKIIDETLTSPELAFIVKETKEKADGDSNSEASVPVADHGRTEDDDVDYAVPECPEGKF